MKTNSTIIFFAVVAALGLVTVVAVDIMLAAQEAEARGCPLTSPAANASRLRCVQPDVQSADEQNVESEEATVEEDEEDEDEESTAENEEDTDEDDE
jgi:hypothetical protein